MKELPPQTVHGPVSNVNSDVHVNAKADGSLTVWAGRDWWPMGADEARATGALLVELARELTDLDDLEWLGMQLLCRAGDDGGPVAA